MALWAMGEVVYLNSGSPPMKIVGMDDGGNIRVIWTEKDAIRQASFHPACLTRTPPDFEQMAG